METNADNTNKNTDSDNHLNHGEREETAFSQPEGSKDENGAGGRLGIHDQDQHGDEEFGNDNPGGAGSTGSASTNS